MNHLEANCSYTQPRQTRRRGHRWTTILVVIGLVALAASAVSCTMPSADLPETSSGGTSVTVIATASPVPTSTPVSLEPSGTPTKRGYRLVYGDEFSGPQVDTKRWATTMPWGDTTLKEDQRYSLRALSQGGGTLTVRATASAIDGKPYASGVISSQNRFAFKYGYAETRMQVPSGDGLWSAFWLLSLQPKSADEIDIAEVLGSDPGEVYEVLHYGTSSKKGKWLHVYQGADLSTAFHTFAVEWEPEYIIWYVDGVERYRVAENVPSDPMIVMSNLAVGGKDSWSGPPRSGTQFPATLKIDYIRIYQRN